MPAKSISQKVLFHFDVTEPLKSYFHKESSLVNAFCLENGYLGATNNKGDGKKPAVMAQSCRQEQDPPLILKAKKYRNKPAFRQTLAHASTPTPSSRAFETALCFTAAMTVT